MGCGQQNKASTSYPTLLMVALGLPTLHMALAGVALVVWAVSGVLGAGGHEMATPLKQFVYPAAYAAAVLGPVYLVWVAVSRRLSRREKIRWSLAIVVGIVLAMPAFYVFIARRYLAAREPRKPALETPGPTQQDCPAAGTCVNRAIDSNDQRRSV